MPLKVDWVPLRVGSDFQFMLGERVNVPPLENRPIYVVRQLGAGTYGETYAMSFSPQFNVKPQLVLKMFKPEINDPQLLKVQYSAAREYAISDYLMRRIGPQFCTDAQGGACAIAQWTDFEKRRVFLLFPYVDAISLSEFVRLLHTNMFKTLSPNTPKSFAVLAHIAANLLDALAQMHSIGLFHNDLSPDNALVTNDQQRGARAFLIDFGLSCAETSSEAARNMLASYGVDPDFVFCELIGGVNAVYGDPAKAEYEKVLQQGDRTNMGGPGVNFLDSHYWRFDVYSAGVIINTMFNPKAVQRPFEVDAQTSLNNGEQVWPIFDFGAPLPIGLRDIISEMTSVRSLNRRQARDYATFFREIAVNMESDQPTLAQDLVPGILPGSADNSPAMSPQQQQQPIFTTDEPSFTDDDEFFLPEFTN